MNKKLTDISDKHIFYVSRDLERALWAKAMPFVSIITNNTPFAKILAKKYPNIILIESETALDTWQLLEHPQVITKINTQTLPHILVFKNTKKIESICTKEGWILLNPTATLSNSIEEKITQVEWLDNLASYLPPHRIETLSNIVWADTPFILQFNRSHTGSGTLLIHSKETLQELQQKFPHRPVRISTVIDGAMITSNNVVSKDDIIVGNINYQITGLFPFTDQAFATIGNDWGVAHTLLDEQQRKEYSTMVHAIGGQLRNSGWRGLFGIDVMIEQNTGKLFLIEINARQAASTTFESYLQTKQHKDGVTIGEAHLLALLEISVTQTDLIPIKNGAQIILRNKQNSPMRHLERLSQQLESEGLTVFPYENTKPGSDALRIQSSEQIMTEHNIFNDHGKRIATIIGA
ncbi:ATP-grasp domain-containing protein [Patescibacteria group bacterium]|nr:ATP-grasp domain-containing protein [Patescibacteria group bacterium]MBU1721773.1 ATP-grasp domain-containing protein [Patescibacteria group bacterium]MBU1901388.1 ATP-grasp domain-containing protein [Patescibacteria group bacterium]